MLRRAMSLTAVLALTIAGTAMTANAQFGNNNDEMAGGGYGPEQGSWELIFGGGGTNDKDFESGSANFNAEIGYYFTPNLEGVFRQGLIFADTGQDRAVGLTSDVGLDYHFDLGALRPFVGGTIGAAYGEAYKDTFELGPEVGAKYYVMDQTFLYGRAAYTFLISDPNDVTNNFDNGKFDYFFGIGFNF